MLLPGKGIARRAARAMALHAAALVQLGLTRGEIREVYQRVRDVIERVDSGRTKVF
jgi:hypothetical protein